MPKIMDAVPSAMSVMSTMISTVVALPRVAPQ
eukprot:CAMPEP_0197686652 /NCGR_PEP_ID=MMETSP1338-20131121/102801_1 /TAXON_ID=43686 ORGANISM="Pelagodinium beii, Strain RCC1491" /NCGR_SAMPLE_ID=MMETSP1338 /ASSEMBLY_ACC=CAM_ASM_000754 /LENGTH=31 /DNA_ID= /DNA_START= /DNA_END= /DNA_ORIENTATION=